MDQIRNVRSLRLGIERFSVLLVILASYLMSGRSAAEVTNQRVPVLLPIEVFGPLGTIVSVRVGSVPSVSDVAGLVLRIHGLHFSDMVSLRVNETTWISLNNRSAQVAGPGKRYGGIGGAFATLDLTVPLPHGCLRADENTIDFRFNGTDGVVSGFRVLSFNFVTPDGHLALGSDAFVQDLPGNWQPPLAGEEPVREGEQLWRSAPLVSSSLPDAVRIGARCTDCHAQDGRDLKYFNYSNASIISRARFHGLSEIQGQQIASYIRSLTGPNPGRPWNPPFQPGPGLTKKPVNQWSAGAGLDAVLSNDADAIEFLFGKGESAVAINADTIKPDGDIHPRDIPVAMQLPDWNHWLPRVHPMDAWGGAFASSRFSQKYGEIRKSLSSAGGGGPDAIIKTFGEWVEQRQAFLFSKIPSSEQGWTPDLANRAYSTQLWQLVKTWEVNQEFGLESRSKEYRDGAGPDRAWLNLVPAATAPAAINIPNDSSGMNGSALLNAYFSNAWYELQILVDGSDHGRNQMLKLNGLYTLGRFLELQKYSHQPEPGRATVAILCAFQATDPQAGPTQDHGWHPARNIDPRVLVDSQWEETFKPLTDETRTALTEAMVRSWLDKNQQYPIETFFNRFMSSRSYKVPKEFRSIAGGRVWDASPWFLARGVSASLMRRVRNWGQQYDTMASRFSY